MYTKINIPKDSQLIIDKYLFIPKSPIATGYLHLLEHMIIRNNLESLIKESIEFNGYTDDIMAIEIMSKTGFQLISKNFSLHDLNIEKQLILQERFIYPEMDKKSNQILGTIEEINSFNIEALTQNAMNLDIYHIVYGRCDRPFYEDIYLKSIYTDHNHIILDGLPVHIFEIMNSILNEQIFEINYQNNSFTFSDKNKLLKAIYIMYNEKLIKNIFKLYCLNLKEYRVLDDEVCNAIKQKRLVLIDVLKLAEEFDWQQIGNFLKHTPLFYSE